MTTSIRVPDTISKLSPSDTYPVVQGADVGGFPELKLQVDENTAKISQNIENIAALERQGKTFTYVGTQVPVYDNEQHGNYVLVFDDGRTTTLNIQPPMPIGDMVDGALFTIFNDDQDNNILFVQGTSNATINGGISYNVPPENFASFVFQLATHNYLLLESGYIPASQLNIAAYVAMREKDRLHTFQQIEDEGFLKGVKIVGAVSPQNTLTGIKEIKFQNGQVTQAIPGQAIVTMTTQGQPGTVNVIAGGQAYPMQDTLEFTQMAATSLGGKITLTPTNSGVAVTGNPSDYLGVTKLTFPTSRAGGVAGTHEVQITPYISFTKQLNAQGDEGNFDAVRYLPPLQMTKALNSPASATLYIDPDAYKPKGVPSLLLSLSEETRMVGPVAADGAASMRNLPLNHTVFQNSTRVFYDETTSTIKVNRDDNADLAEPEQYLFAAWLSPIGWSANADGFIRVSLVDDANDQVVEDANGASVAYQVHFKQGERFTPIEIHTVLNVFDNVTYRLKIDTNYINPTVSLGDRVSGPTLVLLQGLAPHMDTGEALDQYQHDVGAAVRFTKGSFEDSTGDFDAMVATFDSNSTKALTAGSTMTFNRGFMLHAISALDYQIDGGSIEISHKAPAVHDFIFGQTFSAETTDLLKAAGERHFVYSSAINNNFHTIGVFGWSGATNVITSVPFTTRNNDDTPHLNTGWSLLASRNEPDGTTGADDLTFDIPDTVNNVMIALYPQQPANELFMAGFYRFNLNTSEPVVRYLFAPTIPANEQQAKWNKSMATVDAFSYSGWGTTRYTLNDTPTTGTVLPVGLPTSGADLIGNNVIFHPFVGQNEGYSALQFKKSGVVEVQSEFNLYTDKGAGVFPHTTFWYSKVIDNNGDLSFTKIDDSETEFTVWGGIGASYPQKHQMRTFKLTVSAGDSIVLYGKSDQPDGAFVQATGHTIPIVHTVIQYQSFA